MVVVVVLCLVALFGILVLVLDVGGLLYTRRMMVNGSDAAALAAAQSCAKTNDGEDPEAFADQYAADNIRGVATAPTNIIDGINCDTGRSGYVTVEYVKDQQLFFAPVLGVDDSAPVRTQATARWGGVGAADGVIPLVVYKGFFQGNLCDVPDVQPDTTCYIWEDNNLSGEGNFGFLDVQDGWNVDADEACPNDGGDQRLEALIDGSIRIDTLTLNYPYATWACTRSGNHSQPQVWTALLNLRGQTRDFPVVGVSPADNQPQQIGSPKPKYNVVGFAQMEIVDVLTVQNTRPISCQVVGTTKPWDLMFLGQTQCGIQANANFVQVTQVNPGNVTWTVDPTGVLSWTGNRAPTRVTFTYTVPTTNCGSQPAPNSSAHCLVLKWHGYSFETKPAEDGENFGEVSVNLCDTRYDTCGEQGL